MPLATSVNFDRMITVMDTRMRAYHWIKENIPPGSRILRLPYTPEFMPDDKFKVQVDWEAK